MDFQDHSLAHSENAKIEASAKLEKLKKGPSKRKRRKRELVDVDVSVGNEKEAETILNSMQVRGRESWAKISRGSVKLVRRFGPAVEMPATI